MSRPHVVFWNANGLTDTKLNQLDLHFASNAYDNSSTFAICVVETKHCTLPKSRPNAPETREIPGFIAYRKPFAANSAGIATFLRACVAAKHRADLEKSPHCMILECRFPTAAGPCLLCICYRRDAEGADGWKAVKQTVTAASKTNLPLIIVGDFNAHSKDFGDKRNCFFGNDMTTFIDDLALSVLNTAFCPGKPTRKNAVLDLAITNDESLVCGMKIGKPALFSDHACISLTLQLGRFVPKQRQPYRTWNIRNADWDLFACTLNDNCDALPEEFKQIALTKPAQNAIDAMVEKLEAVYNLAAQTAMGEKVAGSKRKPWWHGDTELTDLFKKFNRLKRNDYRCHTPQSQAAADQAYRDWKLRATEVKQRHWDQRCKKIADGNQVNWSAFKSCHKPPTFPVNCVRDEKGQVPSSDKEALNSLGKHFANVCTLPELKEPSQLQEECRRRVDETNVRAAESRNEELDKPFKLKSLQAAIGRFKSASSAPGPDRVPISFLKHSTKCMLEVLLSVFNYSWANGVVPSQWRQANVCAIFKPGKVDRSDPDNYRPISLTSVLCKLFERMILKRLWFAVGDKLHARQFGFRGKHSTLDALLRLQRNIFQALKKRKMHLNVLFLDISKAFDRTWHAGLLSKLANIGVQGNAWRWCRAFLSDRKIRSVHDGQFSDWFSINAGVPQGSVLSPFLFLVYINDVFDICPDRVDISLYADDIAMSPKLPGKEGDDKMVRATLLLEFWAREWRLEFSINKSKQLCFYSSKQRPQIRLQQMWCSKRKENVPLERVSTFDYLGLRWHERCGWTDHVDKVIASARKVSYLIKSVITRDNPSLPVIRFLCHALIRTKFAYGLPIWHPSKQRTWRTLDVIISEPMRHCLRLPKSTCLDSLLIETRTLPLKFYSDQIAVKWSLIASNLPETHSTREILREQKEEKILVQRRPPLFALARQSATAHEVPDDLAPKKLRYHFAARHRHLWRQQPHGKLLQRLTNDQHDSDRKFALPEYLLRESRQDAALRAKLRFDRSSLKDTLRRQNILETDHEALCPDCRVRETVEHVIFDCPRFSKERELLREDCAAVDVSVDPSALNWLLGDVHSIDKHDRSLLLTLSSSFICSISTIRPEHL
jgi:Reverse transcriptase (RNA-dependent DNA polymerase)/Endonuclease-reverse transcriptase